MKRRLLLLLPATMLLAYSLILVSCQQQARLSSGTFNYFLGEPVSIDPLNAQESEGLEVIKQVFDGLVDYNPKTMAVIPAVAKSWKINRDATTFTFHLKSGVKFHNGREVVASDFKYAWERVAAKKSGSEVAYHLAPIKGFAAMQSGKAKHLKGVKAPDKYTLTVKLNYPFSDFVTLLGHPVFSPVPKEEVEKNPKAFQEKPIGNGPFKMAEPWKHGQYIKLRRFDNYYGHKPWLQTVVFRIFSSQDTAYLVFKGGQLDFASIPLGQVRQAKKEFGSHALVGKPQLSLSMLGFNLSKPPFNKNRQLRQAINYAINRQAIVKNVYQETRIKAERLLPPALTKEMPQFSSYRFKPARAKQLLEKAGYPGGKGLPAIKLIFASGRGFDQVGQIIQANLKQIGIKIELQPLEFGSFIKALKKGEPELFALNWSADYPTADSFLYSLFSSASEDNIIGYKNKAVDKLLLKARKTRNFKARQQLYAQTEKQVLFDSPVVPLSFYGSREVYSKNFSGVLRTPLADTPLERVKQIKP
jgi:peptide/nickel transport system substrate-binding protein/oligopeptide transport system substrate-binding protein